MSAHELEALLQNLLLAAAGQDSCPICDDDDAPPEIREVRTFEDAGLMTRDRGVVVETNDGQSFQIAIVRSR